MKHTPISTKDHHIALSFGLLSGLFLSLSGAFGKSLTTFADLSIIIFIRFFGPFILILISYLFFRKQQNHKISLWIYLLRAMFITISQYCLFYLLGHGNILLAILLYSTHGMFTPFLEKIVFKYEIKIKTFIAILLGIIGVGITLGPIRHISSLTLCIGLCSGFFAACSQITLHHASKQQDPITINLLNYGFSSLIALFLVLIRIPSINISSIESFFGWHGVVIILLFSLASIGNQVSRSFAYARLNKAASLTPYIYSSLIFSALIDWIWLGIMPMWYTYVGITIIILSSVIMSIRSPGQLNNTTPQ